jgi:hypothetical protein
MGQKDIFYQLFTNKTFKPHSNFRFILDNDDFQLNGNRHVIH